MSGAKGGGLAGRALPFLLLLLPLLFFDPAWIQAERAHRGLAMIGVGLSLLLLLVKKKPLLFPSTHSAPIALWVGLALVSCLWAWDPWLSLETSLWYLCLLFAVPLGLSLREEGREAVITSLLFAILLVGVYGIAQSFGLSWPYAGATEVLGPLANRNASAEWLSLALLSLLALRPRAALVAAPVALFFVLRNGSRGPALALSVSGLFVFFAWKSLFPSLPAKARPLALSLCLPFLLLMIPLGLSTRGLGRPSGQAPQGGRIFQAPAPKRDTLLVRKEVLAATLRMTRDHLPLGVGAGNFRVLYPEYRSPEEIRLTTFDHQFQTRALSAHNDLVQLLAELGLLALLPLAWFLRALWKSLLPKPGQAPLSPPALLPIVGLFLLSLSRAPLLNAPTALLPFLALGLFSKRDTHVWPRRIPRFYGPLRALAGLLLLLCGSSILLGHSYGAAFARAQKAREYPRALHALQLAHRLDPIETDWPLLEAQLWKTRDPARAARLLDQVLRRRPGSYRALIERARLGLPHPKLRPGGKAASDRLLRLDPKHPMALLLASEYRFLDGQLKEGLDLLQRLHDPAAIDTKRKQVLALANRASLAQKIPLMRLAVELKQLGRKLFPADPRFGARAGTPGAKDNRPKKEQNK